MKLNLAVLSLAVLGASATTKEKVLRGKHHHRVLEEGEKEKGEKIMKEKEEKVMKEKVMKDADPEARAANVDLLNKLSQSTVTYAGGLGHACRAAADGITGGPDDELAKAESNQYFDLVDNQDTLQACQELCTVRSDCVGVEYGHGNKRCELWKVELHMFERDNSWGCYRKFQGGEDAICLASSNNLVSGSHLDESDEYVNKVAKLYSLSKCTQVCADDPTCTGVDYDECENQCRIWRSDIGLMIPVKNHKCLTRYQPTSAEAEPDLKKSTLDAVKLNSP